MIGNKIVNEQKRFWTCWICIECRESSGDSFRIPYSPPDGVVRGAKLASWRDSRIENQGGKNRQPVRIFK